MRVDHANKTCYFRGVIVSVIDSKRDSDTALIQKAFYQYTELEAAAQFVRQLCDHHFVAIASVDETCAQWPDSMTDAIVWLGIPREHVSAWLEDRDECYRGSFALVGKAG
eukprot:TRINITY_DN37643_c0_g1_i1.p2 TRINITY_DN37643_c0_g1~~TRINITY_DN37643_c0_g1_i1.p2  ORF type:complete len:110 (+),score=11.37 TRINITY_DN37643_c0_g1_i1:361-690(+)